MVGGKCEKMDVVLIDLHLYLGEVRGDHVLHFS